MAWSSSSCMAVLLALAVSAQLGASDLSPNYYSSTCPNLESIVRGVVAQQRDTTIRTIGSTIRLFFHDCFVEVRSDTPSYDVASGGPFYPVELGRLDGLSSSASSVTGQLPHPTHTINQLVAIFRAQGLTMSHMVALSAAHTVGQAHCDKFSDRLYGNPADPTLNPTYAAFLRSQCPSGGSPNPTVRMDQATPAEFDNQYFRNLQDGGGLLASDQLLYTDSRTRTNVNAWAASSDAFSRAFVDAITKLGRVGLKSGSRATYASGATSSTDNEVTKGIDACIHIATAS
ncbi:hypothetical protein ACQ4PT_027093 [Festuca glaucescens]